MSVSLKIMIFVGESLNWGRKEKEEMDSTFLLKVDRMFSLATKFRSINKGIQDELEILA